MLVEVVRHGHADVPLKQSAHVVGIVSKVGGKLGNVRLKVVACTQARQQVVQPVGHVGVCLHLLQQALSRDDVMEYLTNGVREQSLKVLMELLVHKVTLWDDHIEVEFNYSDKTNPDGPVTARRDFSFLQTKTQANSLVRLGYDVVE